MIVAGLSKDYRLTRLIATLLLITMGVLGFLIVSRRQAAEPVGVDQEVATAPPSGLVSSVSEDSFEISTATDEKPLRFGRSQRTQIRIITDGGQLVVSDDSNALKVGATALVSLQDSQGGALLVDVVAPSTDRQE